MPVRKKPAAVAKKSASAKGAKPVKSKKTVKAKASLKPPKGPGGKGLKSRPAAAPVKTVRAKTASPKKKAPPKRVAASSAGAKKRSGEKKTIPATLAAPNRTGELKKMLITRRNAILNEAKLEIAKYISGENRQLVETAIDEGDWATVDISEEISLKRLGTQRKVLLDIDECLRKIQENTYGICEECGEEISAKRLNVIPTATLCIGCKENREKMEAFEQAPEM